MKRIAMAAAVLAAPLALLGARLPAQEPAGWGDIKGQVLWAPKEIPVREEIKAVHQNADKAHCLSKGPVLSEQWVVDPKTRGLRYTFVWLVNADSKNKEPLPINPKLKNGGGQGQIDQPTCAFIPHALALRAGETLVAKNSSPVTHNIKWTGAKNQGNVTLPPGAEFKIKNLEAERLPMQVECNIHPWMNARVGVFAHPYYALTDKDGNFEIKGAPAGTYHVVVWNNGYLGGVKGRFGIPVTIPAGGTADMGKLEFTPPAPNP